MPGAFLSGLAHEFNTSGSEQRFHVFGLISSHNRDRFRRCQVQRRLHHVFDQRLASGAMQNFGALGSHTRTQTRG